MAVSHRGSWLTVLLGVLLLWASVAGCATYSDRLGQIRADFYGGDLDSAAAAIDKELKHPRYDKDVLLLERSMVELASGNPRKAEQTLREVRDRFDYLEQDSAVEKGLVMLTDDTRSAYAGEDYEKILIRAMLTLSNLMVDGSDAGAYALQVADKQEQIVQAGADDSGENPKLAYKRVALGAYVHGALREETQANYDDVARCYAKVVSWEPEFAPGQADLERARHGHHSAPGNGVLYVFTFVGRGPYKEETIEVPSSAALLIADRILSVTSEHTLPPTIAPIKVPAVVVSANRIQQVGISLDGQPAGQTQTITDVGRFAVEQYQAIYAQVLARAIVRRVVKKAIVYGAKEAVNADDNPWINLAMDVGGVAWEATEAADTRCWGLLPDKIQVLRVELPAGVHRLSLTPLGSASAIGPEQAATVTIEDGRNTYVLANFPDANLVGQILTSQHEYGLR